MKKIFFLLIFPHLVSAQKNYTRQLDEYVQVNVNSRDFSGVVLVTKQNKILLKKAYEQADREWNSQANRVRLRKIQALDSTLNYLTIQNSETVPLAVYILSRKLYGGRIFFQNSGTLDQLKNSGGLRLINNRKIVDSIEGYDQQVRRMGKRDDLEVEEYEYNRKLSEKLFDAKSVIKAVGTSTNIADSQSIKIDLNYLNEYINNLLTYKGQMIGNSTVFEASKSKAINLLQLIKKEYHLEK